jgi:hypothetical protein
MCLSPKEFGILSLFKTKGINFIKKNHKESFKKLQKCGLIKRYQVIKKGVK